MVCSTVQGKKDLLYCTGKYNLFCHKNVICYQSSLKKAKAEHMKHLHNQVYLDNVRRKFNRTNSYMLKITIPENVMPLKDVEPVPEFAHLIKTICSLYREMQWIKMKIGIPLWEGGIRYVLTVNKRAIIWPSRTHYLLKSSLSWEAGLDSGHQLLGLSCYLNLN